ncbi:WhiB family transcriptional regulator, partial [Kitasatospora sp. NPDC059571]|uniref:WhiB family transcriptional regulator n=1 Tax=Kitasatospora sp. NPDC059571 TaxID=3346871 RepID=UPI003681AFA7
LHRRGDQPVGGGGRGPPAGGAPRARGPPRRGGGLGRPACRRADSALFFHPAGERGAPHQERDDAAKRVCDDCPVRRPCLAYALAAGERYGVWGGLTEDERRRLRVRLRRRSRQAPGLPGRAPGRP